MRISKHIIATSKEYQNHSLVDVAGIGRRKMLLPGEALTDVSFVRESADAIVPFRIRAAQKNAEASQRTGRAEL